MAHEIVWSENAREDFREIVNYLIDEWADDFAEKFSNQISKTLELLEVHPLLGMTTSDFSSIRKIAINRKYILYYMVVNQQIIVVNIYQNSREKKQ